MSKNKDVFWKYAVTEDGENSVINDYDISTH